jgi:hypothetical protein
MRTSETKGALGNTLIPVSLFDLMFLLRIRGIRCRSFRSATLGTERKQTLAGLSNPKSLETAVKPTRFD